VENIFIKMKREDIIDINFGTMVDSAKHQGQRKALIEILKSKGITHKEVLNAMASIPRHLFFETAFSDFAYKDNAFPIGSGQTISQPYTVAFQTQLLNLKPGDKVLEIGTGSGYQCSVLSKLKYKVFSIERHKELSLKAQKIVTELQLKAQFFVGDGTKGLPTFGPFEGIIVTAGAPMVPDALIDQLAIGGRLVIPVGDNEKQRMILIEKKDQKTLIKQDFGIFNFVPLIGANGWKD
jgi:protein-L-isoaspartate(D-aspartate) O-methyltransferase